MKQVLFVVAGRIEESRALETHDVDLVSFDVEQIKACGGSPAFESVNHMYNK